MPKVSVIVPIYGVENYIEKCVRSLFNQTLEDIEYLFIDDCSPDKSVEILIKILEEYPNRKNNVIIHRMEKNSGQAEVRKWGMLNASGDFIIHCDSDDWVDIHMYESMYNKAMNEKSDVVICDYVRTDGKNYNLLRKGVKNSTDKYSFIEDCLFQINSWSLCNKLWSRSVCSGIKYPKYAMGEDMVITMQLLLNCNSIAYVPQSYYNYYNNFASTTNYPTIERCLKNYNQLKCNTDIIIEVISKNEIIPNKLSSILFLKYNVMTMLLPIVGDTDYYKMWRNTYTDFSRNFLFAKNVPFSCKLKYLLTLIHLYPKRKDRLV